MTKELRWVCFVPEICSLLCLCLCLLHRGKWARNFHSHCSFSNHFVQRSPEPNLSCIPSVQINLPHEALLSLALLLLY